MKKHFWHFWNRRKEDNMKLIVGLGNPGQQYSGNRHNVGFMCVSYFGRKNGILFDKKQGLARVGKGEAGGSKVVLARPQTYMNLSGESVARLVNWYKINFDDVIVIHDDLDLPTGKIRIRIGRGAGGHKGLTSIIHHLGTREFIRIGVGISRPENNPESREDAIISYVLSDFPPEDKSIINDTIPRVSEAVSCLIAEDITSAMNKYN